MEKNWIDKPKKPFFSEIEEMIKEIKKLGFAGHIIVIEDLNSPKAEAALEYIEYRQLVKDDFKRKLSKRQLKNLKNKIFSENAKTKTKKEAIVKLAQDGTKESLEILKDFQKKANPYLKIWINFAISECHSLLKSKKSEKPVIVINRISKKRRSDYFKFCDRWCKRCSLKNKCPLYRKIILNEINCLVKDKEKYNFNLFFEDKIESLGFLNLLKVKKKDLLLKNTVDKFCRRIKNFLEKIFSEFFQDPENFFDSELALEELNWHSLVFEVNFYVVFFKLIKEKKLDKISAKICLKSLKVCQKALEEISRKCPGYIKWSKNLSIFADSLLEKLETKFSNLDKIKIIFHTHYDV